MSKDKYPEINYAFFLEKIINVLKNLNIKAEIHKNSGISIDGCKISGSAQSIHKSRVLHHGTLLFSGDLKVLNDILVPSSKLITTKAIPSIPSSVTNIKNHLKHDISIKEFIDILINHLAPNASEYLLDENEVSQISYLSKEKYQSWQWNFGKTPDFSVENSGIFNDKNVTAQANIKKGIICEFITNCCELDKYCKFFIGLPYSFEYVTNRINSVINTQELYPLKFLSETILF